MTAKTRSVFACWAVVAAGVASWLYPSTAEAQIKRPGAHPDYSVELEPHLVYAWDRDLGYYGDEGWGPGIRLAIPFLDNGPVKTINNNMAIGFGFDYLWFEDSCYYRGYRYGDRPQGYVGDDDCGAKQLIIPVVLQWNFFLTEVISVYAEPGIGIYHTWIDYWWPCGATWCEETDSDTDIDPIIFAGGARFMFGDEHKIGINVRLGWPYLSVGASFFL